jgi:CheY-like chemotaxis protein
LDEIDGFSFCQRLKANPAWADIPFVFLTAQTDIESKIRGLELGVELPDRRFIKGDRRPGPILLQKRQRPDEERRDAARGSPGGCRTCRWWT